MGSSKTSKVDVRLITATNRDLLEAVKNKNFREDLYFRLNVIEIKIPPLRKRRKDIPLLAHHFLHELNIRHEKKVDRISGGALDLLLDYAWPGNVRELENIVERAFVVCRSPSIRVRDFPKELLMARPCADSPPSPLLSSQKVDERERESLLRALEAAHWKKKKGG